MRPSWWEFNDYSLLYLDLAASATWIRNWIVKKLFKKISRFYISVHKKNFMSIAKVHNFKGLSTFERVDWWKKIWSRERKNVKNFQ